MQKRKLEELKADLHDCEALWSKHSCDCLSFEMDSLQKEIKELERCRIYMNRFKRYDF